MYKTKMFSLIVLGVLILSASSVFAISNESTESSTKINPNENKSFESFNFKNFVGTLPNDKSHESTNSFQLTPKKYAIDQSINPSLISLSVQNQDELQLTPNTAFGQIDFNDTLTISGILQGPNEVWNGQTVELFIDQTLTDVQNQAVVADQTIVTDAAGAWSFTLTFIAADIGSHSYIVYFYGDLPFKEAGEVQSGSYQVVDPVSVTFSSDLQVVGPSTTYTITVTLTALSGANIDLLEVIFDETYTPANPIEEEHSTRAVVGGVSTYSDTYGVGNAGTFTISAFINNNLGPIPNLRIVQPADISIQVTTDTSFTFTGTIDGSPFNAGTRYYRTGQNLHFEGLLTDESGGLPAGTLANRTYEIRVTGGGKTNTLVSTVGAKTNNTNQFSFDYSLSIANFGDVTSDTITFTATITNTTGINIIDPDIDISFQIIEDLDVTYTNPLPTVNTNLFYYPGSGLSVTVNGSIKDTNGLAAANIPVKLTINDKQNANDAWNASITELTNIPTVNTNSAGFFSITWFVIGFPSQTSRLTLNVSLGTVPAYWNETVDLTFETGSFNFFQSLTVAVEKDIGAGFEALVGGNINTFNETYSGYLSGTGLYRLNVTDQFGRIPNNNNSLTNTDDIKIQFSGSQTLVFFVNGTNNGIFIVDFSSLNATNIQNQLNTAGSSFTYTIDAGVGLTFTQSFTETYVLFGPDDQDPQITSNSIGGIGTGQPDNFTIIIFLDFTNNLQDNIRNVTFWYRVTSSPFETYDTNNFVGIAWNFLDLPNIGSNQYGNIVVFPGHGYWIEWYVIVYDLAGQGLDVNGNTVPLNTYPNYNQAFSRIATIASQSTPNFAQFGDFSIITPDLSNSVLINNVPVTDPQNANVTAGQDIDIFLDLPPDNSGSYDNVTINWWYRPFDIETGEFGANSSVTIALMDFFGQVNGKDRYNYTIDTTSIPWGSIIDYNFTIYDSSGNMAETENFSTVSTSNSLPTTWVQDEVTPNVVRTLVNGSRGTPTPTTFTGWNNETITISYNVTEFNPGSGLWNVSYIVYWYNDDQSQNNTLTEQFLVLNGIDQATGNPINGSATYVATFVIDLNGISNTTIISWTLFYSDASANNGTANLQSLNRNGVITELQIDVDNPPIIITVITTTDSNGSEVTVTVTSTPGVTSTPEVIPEEEQTNNALLIIFGFTGLVGALSLWYQRHNIRDILQRKARARRVEGTLRELIDEIKRLGTEGKYKRAILLTWEALERVSREILQSPRHYNQTAREFAAYISTITIVDRETLITLSSAYEKAKYGKMDPVHDDWDDAVKALEITVQTIIESGARRQIEDDDDWDDE